MHKSDCRSTNYPYLTSTLQYFTNTGSTKNIPWVAIYLHGLFCNTMLWQGDLVNFVKVDGTVTKGLYENSRLGLEYAYLLFNEFD